MTSIRTPPHSVEAEQSVIGAVLLDVSAFDAVSAHVSEQDFYRADHRLIWRAISQLRNRPEPGAVDVVTVSDALAGMGLLEEAGGLAYLGMLAKDTPSAANAVAYAEIVRDRSLRRQLISAAVEAMDQAYDSGEAPAAELINAFETTVYGLSERALSGRQAMTPLREAMRDLVAEMDDKFSNPPRDGIAGAPTGFADLDQRLSGLEPGELLVLAARPAMGKTTLALNMAQAVADAGQPVVVFSLEMPTMQVAQKILAAAGSVPVARVTQPWLLDDNDWAAVSAGVGKISGAPIYIDDTASCSVQDIAAKCRRLRRELQREHPGGLGLVVVDYLQLLRPAQADSRATRAEVVAEFSRGLKVLAKELGCPVIALSQLNRSVESRVNRRPIMADLRDSGAVEQDADMVLFIYRDEVYNEDTSEPGIAEIITAKQRMGPVGTDRLLFQGEYSRFANLANSTAYGEWQ